MLSTLNYPLSCMLCSPPSDPVQSPPELWREGCPASSATGCISSGCTRIRGLNAFLHSFLTPHSQFRGILLYGLKNELTPFSCQNLFRLLIPPEHEGKPARRLFKDIWSIWREHSTLKGLKTKVWSYAWLDWLALPLSLSYNLFKYTIIDIIVLLWVVTFLAILVQEQHLHSVRLALQALVSSMEDVSALCSGQTHAHLVTNML